MYNAQSPKLYIVRTHHECTAAGKKSRIYIKIKLSHMNHVHTHTHTVTSFQVVAVVRANVRHLQHLHYSVKQPVNYFVAGRFAAVQCTKMSLVPRSGVCIKIAVASSAITSRLNQRTIPSFESLRTTSWISKSLNGNGILRLYQTVFRMPGRRVVLATCTECMNYRMKQVQQELC